VYIFGFGGLWVSDIIRRILGVFVFSGEVLVSGKKLGLSVSTGKFWAVGVW
jgi:hypothetical protein